MGLYQRENGYFYIQIREDNKYKRVSLETKHKYIAQELYNAYLLDKVKSKLYKSQYHSNSHTHQDSIQSNQIEEPKTLIKPIYQQYLNQCKIQDFTTHTINGKAQLLKIFQDHRIYHIEALNQNTFNKLLKSWGSIKKDTLRKHIANLKAFLNYCIKQKLYKRDDYEAITLPNPKVGIRETTIQEKDYTQIIDSTKDDDFKLYMMTLWETGNFDGTKTVIANTYTTVNTVKGMAGITGFTMTDFASVDAGEIAFHTDDRSVDAKKLAIKKAFDKMILI